MTIRHWLWSTLYFHRPRLSAARLRRSLSALTKKPASLAGFLYLSFRLTRLTAPFLLPASLSATSRSSQLSLQTPSPPNPA